MAENQSQPAPTQPQSTREPAQDLTEKVGAIRALITINELLHRGMFFGATSKSVSASIEFVNSLHKQLVTEAKKHPDASLIEGLEETNV
jgi:hypothetical protein